MESIYLVKIMSQLNTDPTKEWCNSPGKTVGWERCLLWWECDYEREMKLNFHGEAWKIEVRNWEAVRRAYYLEYGGKYQEELKVFLSGEKKNWGREQETLIIYFLCDKNKR